MEVKNHEGPSPKLSIEEESRELEVVYKKIVGTVMLQGIEQPRMAKILQHLKKKLCDLLEWFDSQHPNDTYHLLQEVLKSMKLSLLPKSMKNGNKADLIEIYISQICALHQVGLCSECLLKEMGSLLGINSSDNTWPPELKISEFRAMIEDYKQIELVARSAISTPDGGNATDSSVSSGSYNSEALFPPDVLNRDNLGQFIGQAGEPTTCPLSKSEEYSTQDNFIAERERMNEAKIASLELELERYKLALKCSIAERERMNEAKIASLELELQRCKLALKCSIAERERMNEAKINEAKIASLELERYKRALISFKCIVDAVD